MSLSVILAMLLSSSWAVTDKEMRKVRVYRGDVPDVCDEMGEITTPNIDVLTDSVREQMLRKMAFQKGANAIQITNLKGTELNALIWKCPKK
ncbi:MAG: hypothetical protein AB7H97_10885 [Pseudobdellovibrionaceae bacterium]